MALTHKQEHFAQLVASGLTPAEAYRQAYDVSPNCAPATIWSESSALMTENHHVPTRIQELKAAVQAAAVAEIAWDKAQLIRQADRHRELALSGGWRGVGSANGALEIIGRATGILDDKAKNQAPMQVNAVFMGTLDLQTLRQLVALRDELLALQPGPELPEGRIVPAVGDEKGLEAPEDTDAQR